METPSSSTSILSLIFSGQKGLFRESEVEGLNTDYGKCCFVIHGINNRVISLTLDRFLSEKIKELKNCQAKIHQGTKSELETRELIQLEILEKLYRDFQEEDKRLINFKEEIKISQKSLTPSGIKEASNPLSQNLKKKLTNYLGHVNTFWDSYLRKSLEKPPEQTASGSVSESVFMETEESLKHAFSLSLQYVELLVSSLLKIIKLKNKYPNLTPALLETSGLKSSPSFSKLDAKGEMKLAKAIKGYNDAWIKIISEDSYFKKTTSTKNPRPSKVEEEKKDERKDEIRKEQKEELQEEESYFAQLALNYHLWLVKRIKSDTQVGEMLSAAERILIKYGKILKPHPLYKIHTGIVTQEAIQKSQEIESTLTGSKKKVIKALMEAVKAEGSTILLTDQNTSQEFDCLHVLATGGLSNRLIKVTLNDLNEDDYEKASHNKEYYHKVCNRAKEALIRAGIIENKELSEIKAIGLECNSPLTVVIPSLSLLTNYNSIVEVPGVLFNSVPIISYLQLNPNQFDSKGDMSWDNSLQKDKRGGLDYFLPIGWAGYGISCLGKYDKDNDKWLTDWNAGWAIAYHGVGSTLNTASTIKSIITTQFIVGNRQLHADEQDVNPLRSCDRKVGKGVYFARKIFIAAKGYSRFVEIEGKKCKVLLQCRLNPSEIRIPSGNLDYYIVPDGTHVRPYRVLIKDDVREGDSGKTKAACSTF